MTEDVKKDLVFVKVLTCQSPMEAEIFPATLREHEIPHRTEWTPSGSLDIFVPSEWKSEAQEVLENAAKVFFSESILSPGQEPKPITESPPQPLVIGKNRNRF